MGPDRSTQCPRCHYDWSHAETDCCPECGLGRNEPAKKEWTDRDAMLPYAGWPIAFVPLMLVIGLVMLAGPEGFGLMGATASSLNLMVMNAFALMLALVHAGIVERCVPTQRHAEAIVTVALIADAIALAILCFNELVIV